MSPLVIGYILNRQRIRMIVGNILLWLRKRPLNHLGNIMIGELPLQPMAVLGLGWVQVPITSTVTTSQRVLVTSASETLTSPTMAIPASIQSPSITSSSHVGPVDNFTLQQWLGRLCHQHFSASHYTTCLMVFLVRSCQKLRQCLSLFPSCAKWHAF